MRRLFFGGVHPPDGKELTCAKPIEIAPVPERLVIPLRQHIGSPCEPLVKVGETVRMGQKIGDGGGLCVPVHSSVSGVVEEIGERPHPNLGKCGAIVIRNDFQDTPAQELTVHTSAEELSSEQIVSIIRDAGIVGMGGAAFPTDIKTKSGLEQIDTLIANGCECEPFITADDVLLRTFPQTVLKGIMILKKIMKAKRTVLAVENNKQMAIDILREEMKKYPEIELCVLPTRYPQGAEKQLIESVTGREVPAGKLPKDIGCAVLNVGTAASVSKAVYEGIPVINRIVTVSGNAVKEPKNFVVRIGTPFSQLIDNSGGLAEDADTVLSGGPMMGFAQTALDVPVIKAVNAITCFARQDISGGTDCIRCGKCIAVCPMHLQPLYLYRNEKRNDLSELERLNLMDCIECGCCSYACPAKLPLTERFRVGKKTMREAKKI